MSRPAEALGARFDEGLIDTIVRKTAEDSVKDVGALPLLSYTLDDMWTAMTREGDGVLRLPMQAFALDGVLVDRADAFLAGRPSEEGALRRLLTLKLATVRADGEPTRRRAARSEFSDEEWQLVSELAGNPYRLLATVTTQWGETYAEVAHETIFKRWDKLKGWIAVEREFLSWRSGLEVARRAWESTPDKEKLDALLMGFALKQAQSWVARRKAGIPQADEDFIALSGSESIAAEREFREWRSECDRARAAWEKRTARDKNAVLLTGASLRAAQVWLAKRSEDIDEATRAFVIASADTARRRSRQLRTIFGLLVAAIVLLPAAEWKQDWLKNEFRPLMIFVKQEPYALTAATPLQAAQERALNPGDPFKECRDCPEMVVVPAPSKGGEVTVPKRFAVAKFELTFDEWDACAANGPCEPEIGANAWGRGRRPVVGVNWNDAQNYVNWLSIVTGKPYRLLHKDEYEYAAGSGWGDDIKPDGKVLANCDGCDSQWGGKQPALVGSFGANNFGLYDMAGNVWEWTDDCWYDGGSQDNYYARPFSDDAKPQTYECDRRVVRGGSWINSPKALRSVGRYNVNSRNYILGFRVARTIAP